MSTPYTVEQLRGAFAAGRRAARGEDSKERLAQAQAEIELWALIAKHGPVAAFTRDGPSAQETRTILERVREIGGPCLLDSVLESMGEKLLDVYGDDIAGSVENALEHRIAEVFPAWPI